MIIFLMIRIMEHPYYQEREKKNIELVECWTYATIVILALCGIVWLLSLLKAGIMWVLGF